MSESNRPTHVPWGDPTECPTCTGQARSREVEGATEWDPVRLDPTDLEQTIRAAEAPISLIRDSLSTLEALGDEGATDLAGDTRRLLMVWDRYVEIITARVERARQAGAIPTQQPSDGQEGGVEE
jgi:hypothetical protein